MDCNTVRDENDVEFYPTFNVVGQEHKMNSIEYFYSSFYTRGELFFKGSIDITRFIDSMNETLLDFNFMFIQFEYDRDNKIGYQYPNTSSSSSPSIRLELEHKDNSSIELAEAGNHLPCKDTDSRIKDFNSNKGLKGLPMAIFKLTTFSDGFIIGYYMNHAFLDQSNQQDSCNLENFKDIDSIRKYGENLGYFYQELDYTSTLEASSVEEGDLPVNLQIIFNTKEIENIKHHQQQLQKGGIYISTNDVIHAILMKLYSLNSSFSTDQDFRFSYLCNMRKYFSMPEETIGNIVYTHSFNIKVSEMRSKSILKLAIANREYFSNLDINEFKKEVEWMEYIQKYNENPLDYQRKINPASCRVSSWITFNYDSITFSSSDSDGEPPFAIHYKDKEIKFNQMIEQKNLELEYIKKTKNEETLKLELKIQDLNKQLLDSNKYQQQLESCKKLNQSQKNSYEKQIEDLKKKIIELEDQVLGTNTSHSAKKLVSNSSSSRKSYTGLQLY
eukprot:gene5019-6248_t